MTTIRSSITAAGDTETLRLARRRLLIATVITMALWFLPYSNFILYPLRLFVTFIHEIGHAIAALVSGGSVVALHIHPTGSGVTQTMVAPWAQWLVFSGGYLGTTVYGALMLLVGRAARGEKAGKITLSVTAFFVLFAAIFWGWSDLFTLVTGILLAAGLLALARFTPPQSANLVASFLAVQCSLNALADLRTLFYLTTNNLGDNDAVFMARAYPLPPTFWAVSWAIASVIILFFALRIYWRSAAQNSRY